MLTILVVRNTEYGPLPVLLSVPVCRRIVLQQALTLRPHVHSLIEKGKAFALKRGTLRTWLLAIDRSHIVLPNTERGRETLHLTRVARKASEEEACMQR